MLGRLLMLFAARFQARCSHPHPIEDVLGGLAVKVGVGLEWCPRCGAYRVIEYGPGSSRRPVEWSCPDASGRSVMGVLPRRCA